jgi:hypothetical protein
MTAFRNHLIPVVLAVALAGGINGLAVPARAHSGDHDTVPTDRAHTTPKDSHDADHHRRDEQHYLRQDDRHDGHMIPGKMYRGHKHHGPMGPNGMGPDMMRRHQ